MPDAVFAVALALVLAALVTAQRWMETRPANTPGGQALRWLARLMMMMLNRQPAGTVPVTGDATKMPMVLTYPAGEYATLNRQPAGGVIVPDDLLKDVEPDPLDQVRQMGGWGGSPYPPSMPRDW